MKAVISKNQFNRIKNFINETKEIPKSKVLKEVDKRGHPDYPYVKGFEYISSIESGNDNIESGKDFLLRKGVRDSSTFKNAIINGRISDSELKKFKIGTKSFLDTPLGKDIGTALNLPPLREIKKEDVIKNPTDKQKEFLDVDGDDDVDGRDFRNLGMMNKISEKKYTPAQIKAFDKNKNGIPFEPKDWKMMDEGSDCGCGNSEEHDTRYMFFSNLEQMMRQARMLLQMDEDMLEDLLNNGHDWAADHIAEAKNNMDQVFDFIMNEMNGEGEDDSWDNEEEDEDEEEREMVYEGMRLKKKAFVSKELKNHLDKNIPLYESEFKYGSQKHIELLKEVKELYKKGIISLNETDEFMINEFDPKPIKVKGVGEVYLGLIQEDYESDEELLSEAVYQGRKVQLGKRMRGELSGKKKFYVFVRNPKTGKVKKITFGQKGVKIKKNNPERRRSFRARHKCSQQKDKLSAAYWSCRAW
jgi:hypothetical protein